MKVTNLWMPPCGLVRNDIALDSDTSESRAMFVMIPY